MRSTFTILALLLLGVFWVARPWALTRMMQCKGDVIYFLLIYFFTCDPCLCKWYVCRHSQPTWLCHFGSSYWSSDHLVFEKPFSLCPCQDSQWWKRVQLRWLQAKTLIPLDPMNLLPWPALSRKWSQKEWGRRKWGGLIHAQWQCTGSGPGREYCTHGTGHGRYGSVSSLLHGGSVNKRSLLNTRGPPAAWRPWLFGRRWNCQKVVESGSANPRTGLPVCLHPLTKGMAASAELSAVPIRRSWSAENWTYWSSSFKLVVSCTKLVVTLQPLTLGCRSIEFGRRLLASSAKSFESFV